VTGSSATNVAISRDPISRSPKGDLRGRISVGKELPKELEELGLFGLRVRRSWWSDRAVEGAGLPSSGIRAKIFSVFCSREEEKT